MYCQYAGCAHLCLGLRSLGCGSLLGSRKLSTCRSPHVCNMWARMMGKSVSISLCPYYPGSKKQADAAVHPLSFDVAATVVLRFAILGLVNLSSRTWFFYFPQGPTNAMHVFVRRATCVKHMNK